MNARQRFVIWVGVLAIVAMGLYPPWFDVLGRPGLRKDLGYHWLFLPPHGYGVELDTARLLVQWAMTIVVTVALLVAPPVFRPAALRIRLTEAQKGILGGGLVLIAAVGVYPPWRQIRPGDGARPEERRYAYGWIFKPPVVEEAVADPDPFARPPDVRPPETRWTTEVDITRLVVQWFVVFVLTVALCLLDWSKWRSWLWDDTGSSSIGG